MKTKTKMKKEAQKEKLLRLDIEVLSTGR